MVQKFSYFNTNVLISTQTYLEVKKIAPIHKKYIKKCIDNNKFYITHCLI